MRSVYRRLSAAVLLGLSLSTAACAGSGANAQPPHGPEAPLAPTAVDDAHFATSLHQVLRDGKKSAPHEALLIGVVRRQLAHAAERFGTSHADRATDSVLGALYLVRSGEGRADMIDAAAEHALAGALANVSPRGDEGQAEVLMRMCQAALPATAPERQEIEGHLAALERWMKDTRTGGPMVRLGADERAAVSRAMVDPDPKAVEDAAHAIDVWIDKAIEFNVMLRSTGRQPDRDEAIEAARALESGGSTMAALYLRHGDAKGAVEHVESTNARRVINPALFDRLRQAADGDTPQDWQALAAAFAHQDFDDGDGEVATDPALVRAALWGTALEAYRRDPAQPATAMLVARALVAFGMGEAAPLVLADAVSKAPPRALGEAVSVILDALSDDAQIEDYDAARRTYAAAAPILAAADRAGSNIAPSPSRARFLMASIEVRAGNLAGARPLLSQALAVRPSVSGYTLLATLERQTGNTDAALAALTRGLAAPDARSELLDVADAHMLAFEIQRDAGAAAKATAELKAALDAVLEARKLDLDASTRARAERTLARALDAYGDAKGASRALDRALSAALQDRPVLAATVLDAVSRALVRKDVDAARAALKRGIEGDVSDDDLVYAGLWLMMLERDLHVPTDGTAERALRAGRNGWTAKLVAFANGKLSADELRTAAHNASQRVEAAFYTALASKIAGDPQAEARLREVSKSPVIDVLEVQIARDLLAHPVQAELPRNVALP